MTSRSRRPCSNSRLPRPLRRRHPAIEYRPHWTSRRDRSLGRRHARQRARRTVAEERFLRHRLPRESGIFRVWTELPVRFPVRGFLRTPAPSIAHFPLARPLVAATLRELPHTRLAMALRNALTRASGPLRAFAAGSPAGTTGTRRRRRRLGRSIGARRIPHRNRNAPKAAAKTETKTETLRATFASTSTRRGATPRRTCSRRRRCSPRTATASPERPTGKRPKKASTRETRSASTRETRSGTLASTREARDRRRPARRGPVT